VRQLQRRLAAALEVAASLSLGADQAIKPNPASNTTMLTRKISTIAAAAS
jgi:hypothetical protein